MVVLFDGFDPKQNLKKMRQYIAEQEETKNLKLDDHQLFIVYNYLRKKLNNHVSDYQMILKTKPYIRVVFQETIETQNRKFQNSLQKQKDLFGQNLDLENIFLDKFKRNNDSSKKIWQKCKEILKMSNQRSQSKGLYLYGPFGTGKTFLLKALANELIQNKHFVLFLFMPDLVRQFKRNWYNNDLIETKLDILKNISYLILDDLGSENVDIMFRDDIFLPILRYRYEKKLPIFFSSNFCLERLSEHLESQSQKESDSDLKFSKIINIIHNLTYSYRLE